MVGLIQKLLLNMVEESAGADAVVEIKRLAEIPLNREFHLNEVYCDEEFRRLFRATCDVLKISQEEAEIAYADYFIKDGQARFPVWFEMETNARDFLVRQPKIHNGFATSQKDKKLGSAINDKFEIEELEGELLVRYQSPNQLCGLYKALVQCVMKLYGEAATVEESCCMKDGAPQCEMRVRWSKPSEQQGAVVLAGGVDRFTS